MTTTCLPWNAEVARDALVYLKRLDGSSEANTREKIFKRLQDWTKVALRMRCYPESPEAQDEDWRQETASNIAHWALLLSNTTEEYQELLAKTVISVTMTPLGEEIDPAISCQQLLGTQHPRNFAQIVRPSHFEEAQFTERLLYHKYTYAVRGWVAKSIPVTHRMALFGFTEDPPVYHPYTPRYRPEKPLPPVKMNLDTPHTELEYTEDNLCYFFKEANPKVKYSHDERLTLMSPRFDLMFAPFVHHVLGAQQAAKINLVGYSNITPLIKAALAKKINAYMYDLVKTGYCCGPPQARWVTYETEEGMVQLPEEFTMFPDYEKFAVGLCVARKREEKIQETGRVMRQAFNRLSENAPSDLMPVAREWAYERLREAQLDPEVQGVDAKLRSAKIQALVAMIENTQEEGRLPPVETWHKLLQAKILLQHMTRLEDTPNPRHELTGQRGLTVLGRIAEAVPVFAGLSYVESIKEFWREEKEWLELYPLLKELVGSLNEQAVVRMRSPSYTVFEEEKTYKKARF